MKLGIVVNTDRHLKHIVGITMAAVSRGHTVIMFTMDVGTKLLVVPDFCALSSLQGVEMSYCLLNTRQLGVITEGVPEKIKGGSQMDNAALFHVVDKVIVL